MTDDVTPIRPPVRRQAAPDGMHADGAHIADFLGRLMPVDRPATTQDHFRLACRAYARGFSRAAAATGLAAVDPTVSAAEAEALTTRAWIRCDRAFAAAAAALRAQPQTPRTQTAEATANVIPFRRKRGM